jgi:hypothetical protein
LNYENGEIREKTSNFDIFENKKEGIGSSSFERKHKQIENKVK